MELKGDINLRLPNFFIIGAQKAASTYLQECLREHPDVFMQKGEDSFFQNPDYYDSGIERFADKFEEVPSEKIIGIKRPNYLAEAECPARIHKHIPDAKIIIVLRNPVDRAVSAYFHYIKQGHIPFGPLNEGMNDILKGNLQKQHPAAKEILEYGLYYKHLKRYLSYFSRDNFLIIPFEEIKYNPLEVFQQTCKFLDIAIDYKPKSLQNIPMRGCYSHWRLRFLMIRSKYKVFNKNRTRDYSPEDFGSKLIVFGIELIDKLILERLDKARKPELDPKIKKQLQSYFVQDVKALKKLLGISLKWKF